jgi:hypothetical protein
VHTGATHSTGHWPRMPPRRCPCTRRFDTTLKLCINIFCEAFTRRGWADKRSLSHADHLPCCRRMRATQTGDERTPELRTWWVLVAFLGSDRPVCRSTYACNGPDEKGKWSIFHRIYVINRTCSGASFICNLSLDQKCGVFSVRKQELLSAGVVSDRWVVLVFRVYIVPIAPELVSLYTPKCH